jgi:hypothetical protein
MCQHQYWYWFSVVPVNYPLVLWFSNPALHTRTRTSGEIKSREVILIILPVSYLGASQYLIMILLERMREMPPVPRQLAKEGRRRRRRRLSAG